MAHDNETKEVLRQIDILIADYEAGNNDIGFISRVEEIIRRFSTKDSGYAVEMKRLHEKNSRESLTTTIIYGALDIVKALRRDYEQGCLKTLPEITRANLFSDLLEQSEYLLREGFKEAAALLAASVMELHLIKLCEKNAIPVKKENGQPISTNTLNSELKKAGVYGNAEHRLIEGYYAIRSDAIHLSRQNPIEEGNVKSMIQWVREFMSRNQA